MPSTSFSVNLVAPVFWLILSLASFFSSCFPSWPKFARYNACNLISTLLFSSNNSSIFTSYFSSSYCASASSFPHSINLEFYSSNFSTVKFNFSSNSYAHSSFYRIRFSVSLCMSAYVLAAVFFICVGLSLSLAFSYCLFLYLNELILIFIEFFSLASLLLSLINSSISFLSYMFLFR